MSTYFAPLKKIPPRDLFDGCLEQFGVREHIVPKQTTKNSRCLTDGRNFIWLSVSDDGHIVQLQIYGANAPGKILNAIADTFDIDIVSEYEPQYWGFNTQAEVDAFFDKMAAEHAENFLADLEKFVRGEPNDIRPGTIGMRQAEIGKALAEKDASLLLPENRNKFLSEIETVYKRDHADTVTLSSVQIALAEMFATHEDDLPSA